MKHIFRGTLLLFSLMLPLQTEAYRHGYERKTEEIYATVRSDISVYSYPDWDDYKTYIPQFEGIRVINRDGEWYEIQYDLDNGYKESGWISKDEFYASCLVYDGRDKQRVADGDYQITFQESYPHSIYNNYDYVINMDEISFNLTFEYIGDNLYTIHYRNSSKYLQPDPLLSTKKSYFWGSKETAGVFHVVRKGNFFTIQDGVSSRYLSKNLSGILCFNNNPTPCWLFRRFDKAISDESLRVYTQYDAQWGNHYYGPGENPQPGYNVFTTSACGIFSTMNAIYSLTGMYADPYALADFAVEKEYRILDFGTDNGLFKAAAEEFGEKYGFEYDGSGGDKEQLIRKLKKGDVAITHVPGHYVCIVDYDKKKKQYLLLDPHYLPKRGTYCYGDWISEDVLNGNGQEGNLEGYEFFYYKADRPKDD